MFRTVAIAVALFLGAALAQDRDELTVRVGLQAVGTFSWVVHAMGHFGVDEEFGLTVDATTYASKQATEIALRADEVDIVVDDFVGVVLTRQRGVPVQAVYPYAKAVGGVVVRAGGPIATIADLEGKTIAAASLDDKSLLILRALTTTRYGFDPQVDGKTLQAAPWLMSGLLEEGEIDAAIPYWHFVSRMTATGEFEDIMTVTEMLEELGLRSDLPLLVVVARETAAPEAVRTFLAALQETTRRMEADDMDGIWQSILDHELYSLPDPSAFPEVRARWEAGLPDAWNAEMIDQLAALVDRLVEIAGPEVLGVESLPAGSYTTELAPEF